MRTAHLHSFNHCVSCDFSRHSVAFRNNVATRIHSTIPTRLASTSHVSMGTTGSIPFSLPVEVPFRLQSRPLSGNSGHPRDPKCLLASPFFVAKTRPRSIKALLRASLLKTFSDRVANCAMGFSVSCQSCATRLKRGRIETDSFTCQHVLSVKSSAPSLSLSPMDSGRRSQACWQQCLDGILLGIEISLLFNRQVPFAGRHLTTESILRLNVPCVTCTVASPSENVSRACAPNKALRMHCLPSSSLCMCIDIRAVTSSNLKCRPRKAP